MLALRGRRGFSKKNDKKKLKSMDPIFFAFCEAQGSLCLNIFLEKNIRFGHPYKNSWAKKSIIGVLEPILVQKL